MKGEGEPDASVPLQLAEIESDIVMKFLVAMGRGEQPQREAREKKTPPACLHTSMLAGSPLVSTLVPFPSRESRLIIDRGGQRRYHAVRIAMAA